MIVCLANSTRGIIGIFFRREILSFLDVFLAPKTDCVIYNIILACGKTI